MDSIIMFLESLFETHDMTNTRICVYRATLKNHNYRFKQTKKVQDGRNLVEQQHMFKRLRVSVDSESV